MLECERTCRDDVHGIPSHWDQTFVDDDQLRRLSDQLLRRLRLRKDVTDKRLDSRQTEDGCATGCYVNLPRCPDRLVVPQTGDGSIVLKTDLSPMSPRANVTMATAGALSSSLVAQVALSRLAQSGFYYGPVSPTEARQLLQPHPPGTFLVRASSDQRFLFSLTLRTSGKHLVQNAVCDVLIWSIKVEFKVGFYPTLPAAIATLLYTSICLSVCLSVCLCVCMLYIHCAPD